MIEDNILIENAVLAFLHNYPDHKWTEHYKVLLSKLKTLQDEQPKDAEVRKRGRPAERQRKKETASVATSTQTVKTTQT